MRDEQGRAAFFSGEIARTSAIPAEARTSVAAPPAGSDIAAEAVKLLRTAIDECLKAAARADRAHSEAERLVRRLSTMWRV